MTSPTAFEASQARIAAAQPVIARRLQSQHRWNYEEALLWIGLRSFDQMARALAWWEAYPDLFGDRSADSVSAIVRSYLAEQPLVVEAQPDVLLHGGRGEPPPTVGDLLFDPAELTQRFPAGEDWRVRPGEGVSAWAVRDEPNAEARRRLAAGEAGSKKAVNGVLAAMAVESGADHFKQDSIAKARAGMG